MPTETSPAWPVRGSDSGRWGSWVQWLLIAGVFIASFFCLRAFGEIGPTQLRFRDELGGKPLPPITEWLLQYRTIFMFVGIFIPVAALATFALRDRWQACWLLVALGLASVFEALVVHTALYLPFVVLMKQMGTAAGG